MVHEEVHRSVNEFLGNMRRESHWQRFKWCYSEDLHKQLKADAEARTKTNLVIEAVQKQKDLETSSEIEAEISSSQDYNMEADRVRQLLSEDMLKHDILSRKLLMPKFTKVK